MAKYSITGFADEIDADFNVQLEFLQKIGVKHMEIRGVDGKNISALSREEVLEVKEKLEKAQIQISAIGSPIGKYNIVDDFEPHFESFQYICEIAKTLDANYIRIFSFHLPKDAKKSDYKEAVISRLKRMITYAKEQNLVLLHENEKGIYGDMASSCLELMEELYCEHFKAIFDFANFVQCNQDTIEAYQMMKPYIHYVHVKDSKGQNVTPAGMGDGNIKDIVGDLLEHSYQGYFSIEPHLTEFTGLADLEEGAEKGKTMNDGKFAWWIALNSFKAILYDLEV